MPAPQITQSKATQILTSHNAELYNKALQASSAFLYLQNYNFEFNGPMPGLTWASPDGEFNFDPSNSEINFAGHAYSTISSEERVKFFKWLNHFIRACVRNYDVTYGL